MTRLLHPAPQAVAAYLAVAVLLLLGAVTTDSEAAEELQGEPLVQTLREGGYKIYFRHAATDWSQSDRVSAAGDWTSCDGEEMRQLSDAGRATARRIGKAVRALKIPVARVLSSEYCRAADTARALDLGPVETTRDIMNMRAAEFVGGREAVVRRARRVLAEPPPPGGNVVIVGHGNLMRAATDAYASEGGSGIYAVRPGSPHGFALVARLAPEDWMHLATRFAEGE